MSLRAFHMLFIAASALLALGISWSCFPEHPVAGVAAVLVSVGLIAYEAWFLRKTRSLT